MTKTKIIGLGGIGFFFIFYLSACTTLKNQSLDTLLKRSNCNQQSIIDYSTSEIPEALHKVDIDSTLLSCFSFKSLNVAHAIGLLDMLQAYIKILKQKQNNASLEQRVRLLELQQKIYQKINISSLEIAAVASEMDCEEERADQVATFLKNKEDQTETTLTASAIVVGALGAIASGILLTKENTSDAPELIGIGAGLAEATFASFILLKKPRVHYSHRRNALREIWLAPKTSQIFPPSIWYYLCYENPDKNEKSLRQQIVDRWTDFGQIAEVKEKNKKEIYNLFFGDGGKYTAEQLANRANMHDQIEAYISLMMQDLKNLVLELEKINK